MAALRAAVDAEGLHLAPRLPAYPAYVSHRVVASRALLRWQSAAVAPHVRRASDAAGLARSELPLHRRWHAGLATVQPGGEDDDEARLRSGYRF